LDRIKDAQVLRLIEQIGEHYRTNISNRFLRPILLTIPLDKTTWDQVELLTEKMEIFQYQGFHFDELYTQIIACTRFVEAARSNLLPTLRNKISSVPGSQDKILREMAASNFVSNLQVFADLLFDLYSNLIDLDQQSSGKNQPIYTQIQELSNVFRLRTDR
jgi:hypothetical protein